MNVATKLLIENETDISTFEVRRIGEEPSQEIVITIKNIDKNVNLPFTKEELLEEIPERIYVSSLEWELLNYWKEIGVEKIYKNKSNEDIVLCGLEDQYLQPSSMYSIFKFLEHGEMYIINDLIERYALIEG